MARSAVDRAPPELAQKRADVSDRALVGDDQPGVGVDHDAAVVDKQTAEVGRYVAVGTSADDRHQPVLRREVEGRCPAVVEGQRLAVAGDRDEQRPGDDRSGGAVACTSREGFQQLVEQGAVSRETVVFDNTIQTVGALREGQWEIPAYRSWHGRTFFPSPAVKP